MNHLNLPLLHPVALVILATMTDVVVQVQLIPLEVVMDGLLATEMVIPS
tara:strand:+ start:93 stop:239 length:147 start_codon:yes stop_codon:yes gene_type:complete